MLPVPAKHLYYYLRLPELLRFLSKTGRGAEVQREVLFKKLRRNAAGQFGRDHGFAAIRTVADFRRQVPVTTYEYYRPYLERVWRGDVAALFAPGTEVLMFAMTSGTTGACKHLPITREALRDYRRGWHLWMIGLYRDHKDLFRKKLLKLGSNWRQSAAASGVPCGNISGLVAELTPRVGRAELAISPAVYRIDDPAAKHYTALRLAMACPNVGIVGTANAGTLVEWARLADQRREDLIRDIHDGTLAADIQLPAEVRAMLRRAIARRDPARARELQRIIADTGHLYPKDFWPQAQIVSVWLGGSMSIYLPQLERYYGTPALRDHGLSASEGRMTLPLEDGTAAGLLDFTSNYFEFIPEEEHDAPSPTVLEAHELEAGRNYYILLTTSGGLCRYDIHDVVRCTGFRGQVPLLAFLNKGAHFSSITGEKLSEFQAVAAVRQALEEVGPAVEVFTLAPIMAERPGYVLLVERALDESQRLRLAECVDHLLAELNCEYASKRATGRLQPVTARSVPPGTWAALREKRMAGRGSVEQYKHPCLVGDLDFVAALAQLPPANPAHAA